MASYNDDKYRFTRNGDQQARMLKLRDLKLFGDYASIMMASAVIGFNSGKEYCVPIEKSAQDAVQITFFQQKDLEIIDLIAYAHAGEQSILNSADKYKVFEQYANGGFEVLYKELGIKEDTTIDNRPDLLLKYYNLILSKKFLSKN